MKRKIVGAIVFCMLTMSACAAPNSMGQDNGDSIVIVSDEEGSSSESSTEAIREEADTVEVDTVEADSAESDSVELDTSLIIEEQSFDVQLNDWGKVRFLSCSPDSSDPLADATFYLMDGKKVVYKFPAVFKDDIREWGLFEGISFVAFKDINDDKKDEVIVGVQYSTGAGPQGMIPRTEVRIFEDKGDSFEYSKDLSEHITDSMPEDGRIEDVYSIIEG
ncbi:MAG: hypothetical protein J5802_02515 [Butyrivibrio sp.]|nr:hypothetical protein [Butyrivibrio sp.]